MSAVYIYVCLSRNVLEILDSRLVTYVLSENADSHVDWYLMLSHSTP